MFGFTYGAALPAMFRQTGTSGVPNPNHFVLSTSVTRYILLFMTKKLQFPVSLRGSFVCALGAGSEITACHVCVDTVQVQERSAACVLMCSLIMPITVHASESIIYAVDPGVPG